MKHTTTKDRYAHVSLPLKSALTYRYCYSFDIFTHPFGFVNLFPVRHGASFVNSFKDLGLNSTYDQQSFSKKKVSPLTNQTPTVRSVPCAPIILFKSYHGHMQNTKQKKKLIWESLLCVFCNCNGVFSAILPTVLTFLTLDTIPIVCCFSDKEFQ